MDVKQLKMLAYMIVAVVTVAVFANAAARKDTHLTLDFDQFDSLCIADSIPRNLGLWNKTDVYDEGKEKVITKFSLDKGDTISYEVTFGDNDDFNVIKTKKQ